MSLPDALRRLQKFASTKGDYIGPLIEAYSGHSYTYAQAQAAFKEDILEVLKYFVRPDAPYPSGIDEESRDADGADHA